MTRRATIDEAVTVLKEGRMIIVVDDQNRENEGDLVMAGSLVTPEAVNFMARFGRGLICVPMTAERLARLNLPAMTPAPEDSMRTDFTISVDAREGVTTGISAFDRARTIQVLANDATTAEDLVRPGHVFPLRAKAGGVLRRPGHTEAALDLMRLADLPPVAVICEILNEDGTMARRADLARFAAAHQLPLVTVADLIRYRLTRETLAEREGEARLPTPHGVFRVIAYTERFSGLTHLALVLGQPDRGRPVLTRVHSECLTGDVFGSLRCDCGPQLQAALDQIGAAGDGCLLYLRQEGRGIGLANKIKAYALQDQGLDTVDANLALGLPPDLRDYGVAAQILLDLGIDRVRLITNNPGKVEGLTAYGIAVEERIPLEIPPGPDNAKYLQTKRDAMGHWLDLADASEEDRLWPNIKGF